MLYPITVQNQSRNGPKILVLGAVHGNELCGSLAILRLLSELSQNHLSLERGHLSLVPVVNFPATQQHQRFIDRNLNRIMSPDLANATKDTEGHQAKILYDLIAQHDVVIDLHSMTDAPQPMAMTLHQSDAHIALLRATGLAHAIADCHLFVPRKNATTLHAAHALGRDGILIECGRHHAPQSVIVAYEALCNILCHYQMLPALTKPELTHQVPTAFFQLVQAVRRDGEGHFLRALDNLSPVTQGEALAKYETGDTVTADADGIIFMPNEVCPIGEEWFTIITPDTDIPQQEAPYAS